MIDVYIRIYPTESVQYFAVNSKGFRTVVTKTAEELSKENITTCLTISDLPKQHPNQLLASVKNLKNLKQDFPELFI